MLQRRQNHLPPVRSYRQTSHQWVAYADSHGLVSQMLLSTVSWQRVFGAVRWMRTSDRRDGGRGRRWRLSQFFPWHRTRVGLQPGHAMDSTVCVCVCVCAATTASDAAPAFNSLSHVQCSVPATMIARDALIELQHQDVGLRRRIVPRRSEVRRSAGDR
jgi:hypothetical protein